MAVLRVERLVAFGGVVGFVLICCVSWVTALVKVASEQPAVTHSTTAVIVRAITAAASQYVVFQYVAGMAVISPGCGRWFRRVAVDPGRAGWVEEVQIARRARKGM